LFIWRYGINELWQLAYQGQLPRGMVEEIAKWFTHEEQRRFVDRLVELAPTLPIANNLKTDEAYDREHFGPVMGVLLRVDLHALKRVARQVRREIEIEIAKQDLRQE
jgi:hypothetical protein